MVVNLPGRPNLLHLSLAHDNDFIGNAHGLGLVMGHIDGRNTHLLLDFTDFRPHSDPQLGVQVA